MSDVLLLVLLSSISFTAWFTSMLVGGGSSLILIPLVTLLLGAASVAPVLTIGSIIGNVQRSVLLWQHIDWKLTLWQLPGVTAGSLVGAYAFTKIRAEGLQFFIAIALVYMMVHSLLSHRIQMPAISIRAWHFLPLGFFSAIVSGLVGSTGPLLNPAYLNYGLEKERMIATRSAGFTLTHTIKIIAYSVLGVFSPALIGYGLVVGCAALPANWLGHKVLEKMSPEQFQVAAVSFVGLSGVWMLWQQRAFFIH
ncbi:sulfite exporter TauE/SafE family protein [Synechococcus sp. PCC 7335]|uniref:sulfite exporter TauE/SafE family protein n=1 Tax=Synechococcus sp. (strain ATCC 29403 / PCC 7335) TaxID=91464 RepID=UPI000570EAA2|nr:sulfite exporter TauE/SafE family protein [Synechococcus sp. PCC 7335]